MSSFYYLSKYGANNHTTLDSSNNIWGNNFMGAMLNYYKINTGSVGFLFENSGDAVVDSDDTFSSFYDTYKTIIGSDILSYTNQYSNTNKMAFGDMMNLGNGGITYTNNFSADPSEFNYRLTRDGEAYRYTENGTALALTNDANGDTQLNFTDLEVAYNSYYDYKTAQFDGRTSNLTAVNSALNLTSLGLDYATVMTQSGVDATNVSSVYQNLVDQLVKELKAIKPNTISDDDRIAMEKTLDEKQASLKAIDDALFGYASGGAVTTGGNIYFQTRFQFNGATPDASVETAATNGTTNKYFISSYNSSATRNPSVYTFTQGTLYFASAADRTRYNAIMAGTDHDSTDITYYQGNNIEYKIHGTPALPTNITEAMYNAIGTIVAGEQTAADSRISFEEQLRSTIFDYITVNPTSAVQSMDFTPAITPTESVQTNVLEKLKDANGDGVYDDPLPAYTALSPANSITKPEIINFVKDNFASLSSTDKADAIETIFAMKMMEKYIDQITDAVMANVIDTDTVPDDSTGTRTKETQPLVTYVSDISVRTQDTNALYAPLEIRHLKGSYNDATVENALVKELGDSLFNSGDISGSATEAEKKEFGLYLGELTAGIMEQYWIENFNKSNAEAFPDYFNREFRAYLNPDAYSASRGVQFRTAAGSLKTFNLNFTEDPAKMSIVDNMMEKQAFVQIYSKMEDRSRAEMELFEASAALDVVQNINTQEYLYRLNMLAALEKLVDSNANLKDKVDFSGITRNLMEIGPGASKNPWWEEYFPWFKGFYGNLPEGATPEDMFDKDGNLKASMIGANGNLIDPYIVNINGVDYVMGVDDNKDGKINGAKEILGINDTVDNSFDSLKALDLDSDGIVSQAEMQEKGIVFEAMNVVDRLNGAQIKTDFINSINLSSLQNADGTNGVFGTFEVQLANGKKAGGIQTFETQNYFNNLFGTYVDMSFLSETTSSESTQATNIATKTETPSAATKEILTTTKDTSSKFDIKTIQAKQFNFFSYLDNLEEEDATESVEEDVVEETAIDTTENTNQDTTSAASTAKSVIKNIIKPIKLDVDKEPVLVVDNREITVDALLEDLCWKMDIGKLTFKQKYDILGGVDATKSSDVIIRKMEEKLSLVKNQFSA